MPTLLIATGNRGKFREFEQMLGDLGIKLLSLEDVGIKTDVPETGTSFAENAIEKARAYSKMSGIAALADDSGLVVDALGGEPGVYSARYGGPSLDDAGRVRYLLSKLRGVPQEDRTAHFEAVVAVATPGGEVRTAKGRLSGRIGFEPRGRYGFGYDPIFYLPDRDKMLAELPPQEKNQISHRAVATRAVRPILVELRERGMLGQ